MLEILKNSLTSSQHSLFICFTLASSCHLNITDFSFRNASPCLWNQFLISLLQPHSGSGISHIITSSTLATSCSAVSFEHIVSVLRSLTETNLQGQKVRIWVTAVKMAARLWGVAKVNCMLGLRWFDLSVTLKTKGMFLLIC